MFTFVNSQRKNLLQLSLTVNYTILGVLRRRLHVWLKEELRRLEAGDEGRGYQGPGGRPGVSARVHVSDDGDYGASDVDFHYAADFDY